MAAGQGRKNPRIKHIVVPCPICGTPASWTPENKWRPFCSERCRLIDLGEWLTEQSLGRPPAVYEIELRERMVRIEEELRHQRELIKTILVEMDKRFEAMQQDMDRRFDAMERRFEAVDKRFEELTRRIDRFMFWSFGLTLSVGALIVAALKLWP